MEKTKKNWALRLMVLALAFTLFSTCLMSVTMAKYTVSGTGSDTARVAKWGVEVTGTGDLFQKSYTADDTAVITGNSVFSANKVVAPGTKGNLATFTISGTPEVACKITLEAVSVDYQGWVVTDSGGLDGAYIPIIWKLDNTVVPVNSGGAEGSFGALQEALKSIVIDCVPGATLSGSLYTHTISWEWPFSTNDDNDIRDTSLGNQTTAPTIAAEFKCVITQID